MMKFDPKMIDNLNTKFPSFKSNFNVSSNQILSKENNNDNLKINNNLNGYNPNNFILNSTPFKIDDDNETGERSSEYNIFGSDFKNLKNLNKINHKGKHNLLKIVNMYMRDDKKAQSRMKINSFLKSSKKKKKKTERRKRKNPSDMKLPIIPDDELAKILRSNISNRIYSAHSNHEKNKYLNKKYNFNTTEYEEEYGNRFLKIPKLHNRRGNISLDNSSNYSNTRNDSPITDGNKFKKKKSNIINIVNNVNGNKDKNNNIGLKVNINRYDIKYYVPQKNNNGNLKFQEKSQSENESSKTSEEIYINNQIGNSDYKSNDENNNDKNGINVDIINFSKKPTKKITTDKQKNKEDMEIERKIRRQILHKIKSLNNLYGSDIGCHRPKLDLDDLDGNEKDKSKMVFKRFMSKEINFDNNDNDSNKFDKIDLNDYFEDGENDYKKMRSKKIKNLRETNIIKENSNNMSDLISDNSHSININKFSSANTSAEKINIDNDNDIIFQKKKNKKNKNNENSFLSEDNNKDSQLNTDSDLINEKDYEGNDLNINFKKKYSKIIIDDTVSNNKKKNINEDNNIFNGKTKTKTKIKKKIRKKSINEKGEEFSYSIEVTESIENEIDEDYDEEQNNKIFGEDEENNNAFNNNINHKNKKKKEKQNKSPKNSKTKKTKKLLINEYLAFLLDKIRKGETLTLSEENYIIASGILFDIIEEALDSIFPNNRIKRNNFNDLIENYEKSNKIGSNSFDEDNKNDSNSNIDKNIHINSSNNSIDKNNNLENNNEIEENPEDITNNENDIKNDNKFYNPNSPQDGWLYKYDDDVFDNLENFSRKNFINRRKRKPTKLQSQSLMHKILLDFINPKDLKEGLLRQKQFIKAMTLNPVNYKDYDEIFVKKNLKILNLYSSESEEESYKNIKTKDLGKKTQILKNVIKLTKRDNKIRENWNRIFENLDIDENIKFKFMDIQSNKNQLKNKLEDLVIDNISKILDDEINSDKNNKLSRMLIKLYREENYDLDIEKYEEEAKNAFQNPTVFSSKAKILQENKDYLISAYFEIYDDILNDVFNSGNSIFEFNENVKGNSILKNFEIRPKKTRHNPIVKKGTLKDIFFKKIETLKNHHNVNNTSKLNMLSPEGLSISDKNKFPKKDSKEIYNLERDETTSNYDRLGLANQLYINNILLRDFSYKEKLHYIENSKSDRVSDDNNNTLLDNTSRINDSNSMSNQGSVIKTNPINIKANLIKYFKSPIRNFTNKMNIQNSNAFQKNICINSDLNGELEDEENQVQINVRKNTSDEFNDNENNALGYDSNNFKENVKKRKKKDGKKSRISKFSDVTSNNTGVIKKNENQSAFWDLIKKDNDPMIILKNVFYNKDDVSVLRNQEHCKKLMKIKNFNNIKFNIRKLNKSPSNNLLKSTEIDKTIMLEKKKLMSSTPLTKENTLFKTLEIKSAQLQSFKDNTGEILKFYIKDGNFVKFKDLFEKNKYLIDKFDENGDTLLNIAVKCNHYEIASYLLDHGADVNSQNKNLNAPLHYALSFKNFKMADLLLMKKADEELPNKKGYSPWQLLTLNENIDDL